MTNIELKDIRQRLKLTQYEIAEKLGTARSNYASMEQGRYPISFEMETRVHRLLALEDKKKVDAKAEFMAYIMANRGKRI